MSSFRFARIDTYDRNYCFHTSLKDCDFIQCFEFCHSLFRVIFRKVCVRSYHFYQIKGEPQRPVESLESINNLGSEDDFFKNFSVGILDVLCV